MEPRDLAVLVRRVDSLLDIRLVSALEKVTFELLTSTNHLDTDKNRPRVGLEKQKVITAIREIGEI